MAKLTNTNPTVVQTNESHILDKDRSNQPWPAGAEAETHEAEADDAAQHFQLVAKLTNANPTVVQTNEGRILDRGRSNQPWPAGAEAEADETEADDAAAHFQLKLRLRLMRRKCDKT